MAQSLICPACGQSCSWSIPDLREGAVGWGECLRCRLSGPVRRLFGGPEWAPQSPGLVAQVGDVVSVRDGSGEYTPEQLRRTGDPRWGFGSVVRVERDHLTVAMERPHFGRTELRAHRSEWRVC